MEIYGYAAVGYAGELVRVEVDIRRGIPGIDIVGLADGAVRESKERVRVAVKNSGLELPAARILINLSPAGVKKEGAAFDLPIAAALLSTSGQLGRWFTRHGEASSVLMMGELALTGELRPVRGVLAALDEAGKRGIDHFVVPEKNFFEASALEFGRVTSLGHLRRLPEGCASVSKVRNDTKAREAPEASGDSAVFFDDFADLRGSEGFKRVLEIAAAGRHNLLLFGPPGTGKTMGVRRIGSILPRLDRKEAVEVTRIHSLAGRLPEGYGLIRRPPIRMPHHSASAEGVIGGGRLVMPGELSLAHRGILFLDEAPEFKRPILQSLREPLEDYQVGIARAGRHYRFPADVQLIMAANPCPCGNYGSEERVCVCSIKEITSYWKKLAGPLLDRIEMRVPVYNRGSVVGREKGESSEKIAGRVEEAVKTAGERFRTRPYRFNSRIPPADLKRFCELEDGLQSKFERALGKLGLSARAAHAALRVARTIADLEGKGTIGKEHLFEALQYRRTGEEEDIPGEKMRLII
ncbi:MAG: YifB family Mg chelatase-like AAA ATPase [Spirochaetales bacterium]|nr:YifB family Mg chelatase-like AAA ATPase [Spirochaetales bacterium]MCF7937330.1 YifB family Mg chelatase-like AAA ATPase [Spirochaetales bacterium]